MSVFLSKKIKGLLVVFGGLLVLAPLAVSAGDYAVSAQSGAYRDEFYRAKVIVAEPLSRSVSEGSSETVFMSFGLLILNGPDKGKKVVSELSDFDAKENGLYPKVNDVVVVQKSARSGEVAYYVIDIYRLPGLLVAVLVFFAMVMFFGRWRGLGSLVGLGASIFAIVAFAIPRIAGGADPFWTCIEVSVGIAAVSVFFAHGFNLRTTVAFAGMIGVLGMSAILSSAAVALMKITGTGSQDAILLRAGTNLGAIDTRGLLLGGIMLGVLGILDDVATAQSATVHELKRANSAFGFIELYRRGLSVGKEHISSLVNTLFLAYAGAGLPLFLIFFSDASQPLWLAINSETIVEEIARTLIGSISLMLAVPITTAIASVVFGKERIKNESTPFR